MNLLETSLLSLPEQAEALEVDARSASWACPSFQEGAPSTRGVAALAEWGLVGGGRRWWRRR